MPNNDIVQNDPAMRKVMAFIRADIINKSFKMIQF